VSVIKRPFYESLFALLISALCFILFKSILPKKIFPDAMARGANITTDSLLLEAIGDSAEADSVTTDSTALLPGTVGADSLIHFAGNSDGIAFPAEKMSQYTGLHYLIPFYEKLKQLESTGTGTVRIAYFGDSQTDGDMIVQDFRTIVQDRYGGNGVGFVPISSESSSGRSSVWHTHSKKWEKISFVTSKNPATPFGVSGAYFLAEDNSGSCWVNFKAGRSARNAFLHEPTLFYGNSTNGSAELEIISGSDTVIHPLPATEILNTVQLSATGTKEFFGRFRSAESVPLYGFNFDDGKGVHVDNFSARGNSGLPLAKLDVAVMNQFQSQLGYDLIILHFGTNVIGYNGTKYGWYERGMTKSIKNLRACFPDAAILVISTADKSSKYDLEMKTDTAVIPLRDAQRSYSISNGVAFYDLYSAMGGENSMVSWVEQTPSLAGKDYTHFNFRGARKVANMIHDFIQSGYTQYKSTATNTGYEPVTVSLPDSPSTKGK